LGYEEWRPRRLRRFWRLPRNWMFEDIDETFRQMQEMMRMEFEDFAEKAPRQLVRERTLPDGTKVREWGPFVYGYTITMGPEGKPKIREFGNIKPSARPGRAALDVKSEREPLTDVNEVDDEVRVTAELPGVEKEDIKLKATSETLTISVDKPEHQYYKKLELPTEVDPKQAKSAYKNGVLTVTIKKRKQEESKGETINVD
jgi:HSP20 family protein